MRDDELSLQFPAQLPLPLFLWPSVQKGYMCNTFSDQFCNPPTLNKSSTHVLTVTPFRAPVAHVHSVVLSEKYSCNRHLMWFYTLLPNLPSMSPPYFSELCCDILPSCSHGRICLNLYAFHLCLLILSLESRCLIVSVYIPIDNRNSATCLAACSSNNNSEGHFVG